ncbi:AtuA-related protein [Mycobacterium decipiens]
MHAALDGGVVAGLRRDKHGKSLSGYMLEIELPVPHDYVL